MLFNVIAKKNEILTFIVHRFSVFLIDWQKKGPLISKKIAF